MLRAWSKGFRFKIDISQNREKNRRKKEYFGKEEGRKKERNSRPK
jgi:hypothetical protein